MNMAFELKVGTLKSLHCLNNNTNRAETIVIKVANNEQKTTNIRILY